MRGGVGEGFLRDEVLAAHLYGAQPAFGGENIYSPLHGGGGFGATCPAIGQHGGGVGDDRFGCGFYLGDLVDACGHDVGEERQERPEPAICARIADDFQAIRLDFAVLAAAYGGMLHLRSAVPYACEVFRAGFRPAHRAAVNARQMRQDQLFWRAADFLAEAAAHIRADDLAFSAFAVDACERAFEAVRRLAAEPHDQLAAVPDASHRAAFQGGGRSFVVDDALLHHHIAVGKDVFLADAGGHAHHAEVHCRVGADIFKDDIVVGGSVFNVYGNRKRLVIHEHHLGGIGCLDGSLRHDRCYGVASETGCAGGEQRAVHHARRKERHRCWHRADIFGDVFGRVDAEHAGHGCRLGCINAVDLGVSKGGADEMHMRCSF